jgi:hypothetical protein
MGYTHYWRQKRAFTSDEWTRITSEAKRICSKASRALYSGPETFATATAADTNEMGFAENFGEAGAWRTFPHEEIKPAMQGEAIKLCGPSGNGPVQIDSEVIALNGCAADNQDYESFVLDRMPVAPDYDKNPKDGIFNFCKTEYRNYDPVVVSILAVAELIAPDAIKLSSDGGKEVFRLMF